MTTATVVTTTATLPSIGEGAGTTRSLADVSPVPWSTVLPLAVPLGMAAGFWTIALRTSVGAIGRVTSPFESWARETAMLLPFFVLAVLAALTWAQRRYGRDIGGFRQVGGVSLLVAGLATVAGGAQLALSSALDYRLQIEQMAMMSGMLGDCARTCQTAMQGATFGLQVRVVLIGTAIMLLTNVLLVAWVVALRGWRLRLTSAPTFGRISAGALDRPVARTLLVSGLVGSALIHAAVVPEHLAEWTAAGLFFVLLTTVELGLAAAVAAVPRHRYLPWACLAASAGPLFVWTVSRTLGMPFGPEPGVPEPVGLADLAACALEVLSGVAALALLRSPGTRRSDPRAAVHGVRLALVLVIAVSALGLGGTGLPWVGFDMGDLGSMDHVPSLPSTGTPPGGSLN